MVKKKNISQYQYSENVKTRYALLKIFKINIENMDIKCLILVSID